MRISDWSSDVCSSDLCRRRAHGRRAAPFLRGSRPLLRSCRTHGALLDAFFGGRVVHDAVDVDARQVHVVRIDGADLDDLFDLDDADPASHRAGRVEVAGGLAEQQVAGLVRSEEHTSELPSLMRISYAV